MAANAQTEKMKHARITRIQKEEEDENWLSGEELRTEGSSDEETTNKRKVAPKARVTTTLSAVGKEPKINEEALGEQSVGSNDSALVEWRPKRGSMQLLSNEVEKKSEEVGLFCKELDSYLSTLQSHMSEFVQTLDTFDDMLATSEDFDSSEDKIEKLLEATAKLDEKINEQQAIWEELMKEKVTEDEEINEVVEFCDQIDDVSETVDFHSSQLLEMVDDDIKSAENKPTEASSKRRKKSKRDRRFLLRNIELAKHGKMAAYSLTEEEQLKLEEILQGIDDCDSNQTTHDSAATTDESSLDDDDDCSSEDDSDYNEFRLTEAEAQRLLELEEKINKLLGACPERLKQRDAALKEADNRDKLWKSEVGKLNERLKEVDKQIEMLRAIGPPEDVNKKINDDCCDEIPVRDVAAAKI